MALQVSTYVTPGVYIGEVVVQGRVNIATTPATTCVIAPGSREKQVTNEAVQRGLVEGEAETIIHGTTGTGDSISAPVNGVQTLTDAGAAYQTHAIGSEITIRNDSNPTNNGTFTIVDRPSATSISYTNPSGVVNGAFTGTWSIDPYIIIGGVADPKRTNRALQNTTLYKNSKPVSDSFLEIRKAHVEAAMAATVALYGAGTAKTHVRVATNNDVDTWTAAGAGVGATLTSPTNSTANNTINGVTLIVGQRVLVKDFGGGASHADNGIYTLTQAANGAVPAVLTRATDFDAAGEITQFNSIFSVEGTTSAGITYIYVSASAPVVDTDPLQFEVGNDMIALELDGNVPLNIIFTAAAGASTVIGTQVTVRESKIAALATASRAEIAAAINEALYPTDSTARTAVTALGYGASYASAASVITGYGIRIASPTSSGPASDVRISSPFTRDGTTTIFGAAGALNRDAPTVLVIDRVAYTAGAAYTADFIDIEDTADALANTGVQSVIRVGNNAGVGSYEENTDFTLTSDTISWVAGSAARFTSTEADTFDISTNDTFKLSIDGLTAIELDLNGLGSAPAGYESPVSASAALATELAANINAIFAANANYGARYKGVATVITVNSNEYLVITSPTTGPGSSLTFTAPAATDATNELFGITTTQYPYSVVGTGKEPTAGAIYFVTYSITRPTTDYAVLKRFFSESQAAADLGEANVNNPLMVGVHVAFRQGISNILVVQVNDASSPGTPTRNEILAALNATKKSDIPTEICVLSTDLAVAVDVKDHIETENSPTRKHYRRAWMGMARSTAPGDKDTADTFVYRATKTLAVSPESPGRGRFILVAPPQLSGVSIDLTLNDATTERVELDSSYCALAWAARRQTFTTPSASLASQTIIGFNLDDLDPGEIWEDDERDLMAASGVLVTTYDAGNFICKDPCTTEIGGGAIAPFSYESTSPQKDNITRKIDQALSRNLVGIVPTDLADFITDVKLLIAETIMAEIPTAIGPFRNTDNTTRRIDASTDIEVTQDPSNPTKFYFKYYYYLKYPALRFFGEFSADNKFFSSAA